MLSHSRIIILIAAILFPSLQAHAQMGPLEQSTFWLDMDSGWVRNPDRSRGVIWSTIVQRPDATWLRLKFESVTLGQAPRGGTPTVLRMTALLDGASQTLDARALDQWSNTTAYFNGDLLLLEVIADPGALPSRVIGSESWMGLPNSFPASESICGPTDDRELSNDPRAGRIVPVGCTGFMIDDANHMFLSAGHCAGSASNFSVVQFNVPLSDSNGNAQQPRPEFQFPIDQSSRQSTANGVGNDYVYFGVFPNTTTGFTPHETQAQSYVMALPPAGSGQPIRITGYGTTSPPVPNEWNKAQKTHVGPFEGLSGSALNYETDTTGGNSGSPVINDDTGDVIGVHTHGGCNTSGANHGTGANNSGLQNALNNPLGVCIPQPRLVFAYPEGVPDVIAGSGQTVVVSISGVNGGVVDPADVKLHTDIAVINMTALGGGQFEGVLPEVSCGTELSFFITARKTNGDLDLDPLGAWSFPDLRYLATGASLADIDGSGVVDFDDFTALLAAWGPCPGGGACAADLDDDGDVDFDDFTALLASWGPC